MSNKSYLDELLETLKPQQELKQLLKDKAEEINKILSADNTMNPIDRINYKIEIVKTNQELSALEKVLKEKEDYFKKYAIQFEKDLKEANQNYKQVIQKATVKAKSDQNIKLLLDKVNLQAIETSKELKVAFYKRFKNLV
jgi:hypothetical protein